MIYPLLKVDRVITQRRTRGGTLVRTRQGQSVLKLAGECIKAGGKVMLHIRRGWHGYAVGVRLTRLEARCLGYRTLTR